MCFVSKVEFRGKIPILGLKMAFFAVLVAPGGTAPATVPASGILCEANASVAVVFCVNDKQIVQKTPEKQSGVEIWYYRIACTQRRIPDPLSLKMISGALRTASAVIFLALVEDQSRE